MSIILLVSALRSVLQATCIPQHFSQSPDRTRIGELSGRHIHTFPVYGGVKLLKIKIFEVVGLFVFLTNFKCPNPIVFALRWALVTDYFGGVDVYCIVLYCFLLYAYIMQPSKSWEKYLSRSSFMFLTIRGIRWRPHPGLRISPTIPHVCTRTRTAQINTLTQSHARIHTRAHTHACTYAHTHTNSSTSTQTTPWCQVAICIAFKVVGGWVLTWI